jgi:ferredoxin
MINKINITDDCIACTACEFTCPEVFKVVGKKSSILPAANFEKNEACIQKAAMGCPVNAIKYE